MKKSERAPALTGGSLSRSFEAYVESTVSCFYGGDMRNQQERSSDVCSALSRVQGNGY